MAAAAALNARISRAVDAVVAVERRPRLAGTVGAAGLYTIADETIVALCAGRAFGSDPASATSGRSATSAPASTFGGMLSLMLLRLLEAFLLGIAGLFLALLAQVMRLGL